MTKGKAPVVRTRESGVARGAGGGWLGLWRRVLGQPRLLMLSVAFVGAYLGLPWMQRAMGAAAAGRSVGAGTVVESGTAGAGGAAPGFQPFGFLTDASFSGGEKVALFVVLGISILGLLYALFLVGQINRADKGTAKMQEVAAAIKDGAKAYLRRQRNTLLPLIVIITIVLMAAAYPWSGATGGENLTALYHIAFGRGFAFLMGSIFSLTVGTAGMSMATRGNLAVAAAAPRGFGGALQLGYRSGTVTGMLTDGLGLLGGTLIFMYFGERAPEALLGFGFGGTLLALFMRVGGGIYTKAADVGADLVGKIEKDIPEDDPRNAATIADNVGDNVGDCAGMAADIFESYEVTMVAAMILGGASFGHKGVIFPLLVRGIGCVSDMISTFSVRAANKGGVKEAMGSLNFGFRLGAVLSTVGFLVTGFLYLRFGGTGGAGSSVAGAAGDHPTNWWVTLNQTGLDMRPAWACFVGIILALVLNWCTEYFTSTEYAPVKGLVKACGTGHATNIIQGLAVGYESSVWAVIIIAGAIFSSILLFTGASPIFAAYGVAMTGIGMLTLTGNTISMDVFGPIADNANGIGEMGYDPAAMDAKEPGSNKRARQILADLDAVGNTTKAVTKGIAIGSAVIAAVSLFASFITVMATGREHGQINEGVYRTVAGFLSLAEPRLFIGLLLGGAAPLLFSSMTIRAVGRAAFLIVKECRVQFRDPEIWKGTKRPDYGRVVGICTQTAQRELIGPGLLAILTPMLVGFAFGTLALAGFLAGSIVSGQLLAVFMANAGGAWDNAKKLVEDEPRDPARNLGKGSERHKASVTGDTVGDPLKDTAGPALNPLIKVMNMVALLCVPLVMPFDRPLIERGVMNDLPYFKQLAQHVPAMGVRWVVVAVCLVALLWAVWRSKTETEDMKAIDDELTGAEPEPDPQPVMHKA
ncbi:MAG TPA: sodium-translocating pyrophosphatase [Phycisphaerae bacterium]|nr:sodium-translocating pyrophosphatase [Phycisphaerae bacterium]